MKSHETLNTRKLPLVGAVVAVANPDHCSDSKKVVLERQDEI